MKKKYKKPIMQSNQHKRTVVPAALAAGAALAGGYVIGRVAKQIEVRDDARRLPSIEKVYCI